MAAWARLHGRPLRDLASRSDRREAGYFLRTATPSGWQRQDSAVAPKVGAVAYARRVDRATPIVGARVTERDVRDDRSWNALRGRVRTR